MREKEAREFIEARAECCDHRDQETFVFCEGYLEAIEKAVMLEECIDGLICGTCDGETAEEVLRKWRAGK